MSRSYKRNRTAAAAPAVPPSVGETSSSGDSREALLGAVVIAAITVLAYSNTLLASFNFDDFPNIVENPLVRDLSGLWPPSGRRWVGVVTFALNYRFGGLDVFGYHAVNLFIHVCNGLLVMSLAASTLRTPALRRAEMGVLVRRFLPLVAGLLFAVHPVATQAVTYVVQRFTSLATLFFLLSLTLYARARLSLEVDLPRRRRAALLGGLSILAAAAAMRAKEISVTLPLVAAGYDLLFFRVRKWRLLLAPLAVTALLVPLGLIVEARARGDVLGDTSWLAETPDISRWTYLLTQTRAVVTYLRLLVLPVRQNVDYDFPLSHSLTEPSVLLAAAVLLLVTGAATILLVRARRGNRAEGALVFFGVAWFFVTVSVESSVFPIRDVIFEHRMYLPLAGAAVALGTGLLAAVERLRARASPWLQVTAALLITAAPLAAATYARNLVWRDAVTLWSDAASKSANKARPHDNLGHALEMKGQLDDAERECLAAIRLEPGRAQAHLNLGVVYRRKGQVDDAAHEYREAIRLAPGLAIAHFNLGTIHLARGRIGDAITEYREAVRLAPGFTDGHSELAAAYAGTGQLTEAIREYRAAIALDPSVAELHSDLGEALERNGKLEDAVREHREAIRLEPARAEAHARLGRAHSSKGQLGEAEREYREAILLDPSRGGTHFSLGYFLATQGRLGEAIEEYRRAYDLGPTPEVGLNLAVALDDSNRSAEAVVWYRRYLDRAGDADRERSAQVRARLDQLGAAPQPGTERER